VGRGAGRNAGIQIKNSFIKVTLCILARRGPGVKRQVAVKSRPTVSPSRIRVSADGVTRAKQTCSEREVKLPDLLGSMVQRPVTGSGDDSDSSRTIRGSNDRPLRV